MATSTSWITGTRGSSTARSVRRDHPGRAGLRCEGDPNQDGAINFAWSIALQPGTGDVFVANRESDQVEVFSPNGTTLAIDGSNGSADGDFSFPQGIAFAPNGNLYVSDTGNNHIQEFTVDSNGTLNFVASYGTEGTGSSAPAGDLNQPTGIAVSPDGARSGSPTRSTTGSRAWRLFGTWARRSARRRARAPRPPSASPGG